MARQKTDWSSHITAYKSSGKTIPQFCEEAGINVGTFRHNLYKSRARKQSQESFREIFVNTELSLSIDEHGQITLSGIEPDVLPSIVRAWSDAVSQ